MGAWQTAAYCSDRHDKRIAMHITTYRLLRFIKLRPHLVLLRFQQHSRTAIS
jgi:hypothetical protein